MGPTSTPVGLSGVVLGSKALQKGRKPSQGSHRHHLHHAASSGQETSRCFIITILKIRRVSSRVSGSAVEILHQRCPQASLDTCRGVECSAPAKLLHGCLPAVGVAGPRAIRRPPTCGRWPAWCSSLSPATCSLTRAPARITSGAGCVRSMPMSVQSRTDQS